MSKLGDEPAFPCAPVYDPHDHEHQLNPYASRGMSLREHYAGLAMQGAVRYVYHEVPPNAHPVAIQTMAQIAVSMADALISILEKEAP